MSCRKAFIFVTRVAQTFSEAVLSSTNSVLLASALPGMEEKMEGGLVIRWDNEVPNLLASLDHFRI